MASKVKIHEPSGDILTCRHLQLIIIIQIISHHIIIALRHLQLTIIQIISHHITSHHHCTANSLIKNNGRKLSKISSYFYKVGYSYTVKVSDSRMIRRLHSQLKKRTHPLNRFPSMRIPFRYFFKL